MKYFVRLDESKKQDSGNGHYSFPLLNESNGCGKDCATGISYYTSSEFTPPAVHEFHEGFMVLSGKGSARVGEEEFPIDDQVSFFVPAGTQHALRSDSAVPLSSLSPSLLREASASSAACSSGTDSGDSGSSGGDPGAACSLESVSSGSSSCVTAGSYRSAGSFVCFFFLLIPVPSWILRHARAVRAYCTVRVHPI